MEEHKMRVVANAIYKWSINPTEQAARALDEMIQQDINTANVRTSLQRKEYAEKLMKELSELLSIQSGGILHLVGIFDIVTEKPKSILVIEGIFVIEDIHHVKLNIHRGPSDDLIEKLSTTRLTFDELFDYATSVTDGGSIRKLMLAFNGPDKEAISKGIMCINAAAAKMKNSIGKKTDEEQSVIVTKLKAKALDMFRPLGCTLPVYEGSSLADYVSMRMEITDALVKQCSKMAKLLGADKK